MNNSITLLLALSRTVVQILTAANVVPGNAGKVMRGAGELLDLGIALAERGDETVDELQALKAEAEMILARIAKTGQGPTNEERFAWRERSDAAHAALQALKKDPPAPATSETAPA
jgi:hypothetical protein